MSILGGRRRRHYRRKRSVSRRRCRVSRSTTRRRRRTHRRRRRGSSRRFQFGINGKLIRHGVPYTLFRGIKKGRGKVTDVASKALDIMKVLGLGKARGGLRFNVNGGRRVRRRRHRTYLIKGGAHTSMPMKLNSFLLEKMSS